MQKKLKTVAAQLVVLLSIASPALAASDVKFPADWKSWLKLKEYPFPCDKLADLPKVVQNVGTLYCPIFTETSKISIYARPEAKAVLDGKSNEYPDGANFVFMVSDAKGLGDILLVKGHEIGEPIYGAFKADGTDIEGASQAVAKNTCKSCHDAYCRPHGVCSKQDWNK